MSQYSVLIVSYRTPMLTADAVESALALPGLREAIVVDNAPGDGTGERLAAQRDERILYVPNDGNVGYGQAANRAAAAATSETLVFLNSDAQLTADAAAAIIGEVDRHGGQCIAAPRLIGEDEMPQRSSGLLPAPSDLAVRALGLHHVARSLAGWRVLGRLLHTNRLAREYASALEATEPMTTNMVSGACIAVGRTAFEELGGFDERFFLYFEDADLCHRAGRAGLMIRYLPDVRITHIGGASSSEDYHFGPFHARSMRQYLGKWYGPGGSALAILLLWLRAVGFSIALRPQALRAWRALWAAVTDEDPRR